MLLAHNETIAFVDEYKANHPGATLFEALKAYERHLAQSK